MPFHFVCECAASIAQVYSKCNKFLAPKYNNHNIFEIENTAGY